MLRTTLLLLALLTSAAFANEGLDTWFTGLTARMSAFETAQCPEWAADARACAAVIQPLDRATNALVFERPPGYRNVGEGSMHRVDVPHRCQGWDTSEWRPGCRLMYELVGEGSIAILVLDREYLLFYLNDAATEAALDAAKDARDAAFEASDAARREQLNVERRANVGDLDTIAKVREMTRDLFVTLNFGTRNCDQTETRAPFSLCGQTHGDIEVFTQFTETHLTRSAYFDGQIIDSWTRDGNIARLTLRIDDRDVILTFAGELGPFKNFGNILVELLE